MTTMAILQSVLLFILAGLCEVGGGWLVWQSLREQKPAWWGLAGGVVLILYGIIPTFQTAHCGRVYAVYGGFFIVLALFWGWFFDGDRPERLGVAANRCVVVEDAPVGIAAARAAGMTCIGLASTGRTSDELQAADLVVGSLRGVTVDDVQRLLRST